RIGDRERRAEESGQKQAEPVPLYRNLKEQRSLLNSLVGMRAKATGEAHGLIHAELRRIAGGPAVPQASVTQLQARIDLLRKSLRS
ncbi:MAG TPA: ATP-dependent helicase, partial [Gryllotalpicola sp.]